MLIIKFILHLKKRNPNIKEGPLWEKFNHASPYVLRIDSDTPKSDKTLIEKWFKVHKFWYEDLPNDIYNYCSSIYDSDFYNESKNNTTVSIEHLLENNLSYYQKLDLVNRAFFLQNSELFLYAILFHLILLF